MYRLQEHQGVDLTKLLTYLIGASVVGSLSFFNLVKKNWFSYCFWNFGLAEAETVEEISIGLNKTYHAKQVFELEELRADLCVQQDGYVEVYCPKFCDYIYDFQASGMIMVFCGVMTLIFVMVSVTSAILSYHSQGCCAFNPSPIPFVFYSLGVGVYFFSVKMRSFEKTADMAGIPTIDYQVSHGFVFAGVLVIAHFLVMLYGYFSLKKLFVTNTN